MPFSYEQERTEELQLELMKQGDRSATTLGW